MAAKKKKIAKPSTLLKPGNVVLIRTAVYHALGRVRGTYSLEGVGFVQLEEAAWIADTGRFSEATSRAISDLPSSEIEPVGSGGIFDVQLAVICDIALAIRPEKAVK